MVRHPRLASNTLPSDLIFELRVDPTTGRKVLIAEERALRPNDFAVDVRTVTDHPTDSCPFCRGHEHHAPTTLAAVNDSHGDWQVRVVPNKYPAVAMAGGQGLTAALAPRGVHEVIIESPRHVRDWTELSTDELTSVLQVFRERMKNAWTEHKLPSSMIFKNVGEAAGASLEHIHSQLVAFPFVPEALERELAVAAEFRESQGECLMCRLVADELRGRRLVVENSHFAAFSAYAARQPYETWVVPKAHASHYTEMSDEESRSLATILGQTVELLATVHAPLAYNAVLHTAPVGDTRAGGFHWHWEIIPRSTAIAGFELGTGVHINPVSPERAAIRLRSSNSRENLPIQ